MDLPDIHPIEVVLPPLKVNYSISIQGLPMANVGRQTGMNFMSFCGYIKLYRSIDRLIVWCCIESLHLDTALTVIDLCDSDDRR